MHVDIGARDADEARSLVRAGDVGVIAVDPLELRGGLVAARAQDDRVGAYVVLEAARRAAEARSPLRLAPVATRLEETTEGAAPAAFAAEAAAAVIVDVTFATDVPGESAKADGAHGLGSGPAIARGPVLDRRLSDVLLRVAEEDAVPHTIEAVRRHTQTDAEAFQFSRTGTRTALVSIPTRYVHTPNELVDLADVEATVCLLAGLAQRTLS